MVVGDVDSHIFVNGGFVCGVGAGECCGDIPKAGHQESNVVFGECAASAFSDSAIGGPFERVRRLR